MADVVKKEKGVDLKSLEVKIDNLTLILDKAVSRWDESARQVVVNQIALARLETNQTSMCEDINTLETKVNGWSAINSIGVVLASTVAAIGAWFKS